MVDHATPGKISHLFTDMDSTFIDWAFGDGTELPDMDELNHTGLPAPRGVVQPGTLEAYKRLSSEGVRVVPCTGRSLKETRDCLASIHEDLNTAVNPFPGIYNDGMVILDAQGDVIYQATLDDDTLATTLQIADRFIDWYRQTHQYQEAPVVTLYHANTKTVLNHPECSLVKDHVHETKRACPILMDHVREYSKGMALDEGDKLGCKVSSRHKPACDLHLSDLFNYIVELDEPVLGLIMVVPQNLSPDDIGHFDSLIPAEYKEHIEVRHFFDAGIGIARKGANKAGAIKRYLELHKHEAPQNLSVIGDGVNDIPMLSMITREMKRGYAFVMGQAREQVKREGSHVVSPSNETGWYDAAMIILRHNNNESHA